jgi:cob(I)alamin adenosyltransferase
MKVYTKTGDKGETSLLSGGRVPKDHHRIEAYGTVDELNSVLGLLLCESLPEDSERELVAVQNSLFAVGAVLADPMGRADHDPKDWAVESIERWIDSMDSELEQLRSFVLPGGTRSAALAHLGRTVCRRCERRVFTLAAQEELPQGLLPYLNRISDALFVLARYLNAKAGVQDTKWHPGGAE